MKEYIVQAIEQETIDSFDAHNAPELVRCKDCRHFYKDDFGLPICMEHKKLWIKDNWFCADGVKKDE